MSLWFPWKNWCIHWILSETDRICLHVCVDDIPVHLFYWWRPWRDRAICLTFRQLHLHPLSFNSGVERLQSSLCRHFQSHRRTAGDRQLPSLRIQESDGCVDCYAGSGTPFLSSSMMHGAASPGRTTLSPGKLPQSHLRDKNDRWNIFAMHCILCHLIPFRPISVHSTIENENMIMLNWR